MAVNDVYQVRVLQNVGSEITMNVLHFREMTAETVAEFPAEQVAAAAHAIFTGIKANMSDDWRVVQIEARRVLPTFDIPFTRVLGAADAIIGEDLGQIIPSASALVVSLYSVTATKAGRGRLFIPGLPESAQNEGQLTEAAHTNFDTWADSWLVTPSTPVGGNDGVWIPTIRSKVETVGSAAKDVVMTTVRSNLGTMRSRRAHPGFGA